MRGNAMSGAPIISGTNQLPNPPISAGMIMKNTMISPCAVTKTLKVCAVGENLHARILQLEPHPDRQLPPISPATMANTRYIVPMSL